MKIEKTEQYSEFFQGILSCIREAQSKALQTVNRELVALYWDIGRRIVEKQRDEKWGDGVIKRLAADLQNMFPGAKGFSERNLWRMRDFYVSYEANTKLSPPVTEISWTHNSYILVKCKDPLEREFYIRMVRKYRWSKNQLLQNIENQTYEKMMIGQTNLKRRCRQLFTLRRR